MNTPDPSDLRTRLAEIEDRIRDAGGDPAAVTIVAVTKTFPVEVAASALAAGLVDLGENYAQELEAKSSSLAGARWHMIGSVQRNKVKKLAGRVALWQTVDRVSLADEIAKRDPGARVLVQVDTTGEASKSGVEPAEVPRLIEHCGSAGLDVRGLMTVGPTDADVDPRPSFEQLRALADAEDLAVRSMGMTRDLELAVAEGSTMIRVGTALFGPRPAR